jgi:hypothetical protein
MHQRYKLHIIFIMKNLLKNSQNKIPGILSRFDSSTDMNLGLSSFHHGKVFKKVSSGGAVYSKLVNALPENWRKKLYSYGGKFDSTSHKNIESIDAEEISKWVYESYPDKEYPAIAIGSSNGALGHLYAALNVPWLPQTFLVPVNKGQEHSVDKPMETIRWSKKKGALFLKNNPGWHLSQMMDPVQDRIRSGIIAYFRIKKQSLGYWYGKFITERLQKGGTIFIINCELKWPVIKIGNNHTFQYGGLGTYLPDEYYHGSKRIKTFLKDVKSQVDHWDLPEPDMDGPEAEWGFDKTLMQDITDMAKSKGYKVSEITFEHPQDISPNIAELYREWYRQNNQISDRLLTESFTVHSPKLTIQTSSVPYWLFFNSEDAANRMEEYLNKTVPYDEIYMMILSHGKTLGGVASIAQWQSILSRAGKKGQFIGMDLKKYPVDFGIFTRYNKALEKTIPDRNPIRQISIEDFKNKYSGFLKGGNVTIQSLVQ